MPVPLRRNRDFVLLQLGQALSTIGSEASGVAYTLLVLALTHSPAKAGSSASRASQTIDRDAGGERKQRVRDASSTRSRTRSHWARCSRCARRFRKSGNRRLRRCAPKCEKASRGMIIAYRTAVVPDRLQGRVTSVARSLALLGLPLGPLVAGLLLESFSGRTTVGLLAAWLIGVAVLTTASRSIRAAPSFKDAVGEAAS